jgi:hypothetical protein
VTENGDKNGNDPQQDTGQQQDQQRNTIHLHELLNRLEGAKGHFLVGQREILIAVREVIKILADLSGQAPDSVAGVPIYLFETSAAMIDYLISYLPGPPPDEILKARQEALTDLISLIDKEAGRTGKFATDERDLLKVDALMSLKRYLEHELEHGPKEPKPRITEVEIE